MIIMAKGITTRILVKGQESAFVVTTNRQRNTIDIHQLDHKRRGNANLSERIVEIHNGLAYIHIILIESDVCDLIDAVQVR